MEDLLECGCGLDVHKESIVACLLKGGIETGKKPTKEIREFGTQMKDLIQLREWLREEHCLYVAMESTGIYWQPIYAVLEQALDDEMHLLVVNARHMRNVPGKKTDMRDAEWIATLLRAGLLKGSFVPEQNIRDLRQYTRYRKALIRDITSQKNRIEKLLQASGFRLSSFLTDIFGISGLGLMQELIRVGYLSPESVKACLKATARKKADEILSNLNGIVSVPQRKLLKMQLDHLKDLQENLQEVEDHIHRDFTHFERSIQLLDSIPGIDLTAAYSILAEISANLTAFPTAQHLCAWAGLAPGNHESAGKKRKQRILHGDNYLKTVLCEVAWVIASQKKLYLSSWYWRLKQRTDSKRAIVALARKLLVMIYAMFKSNRPYDEQKFVGRKHAVEQKHVKRMINELAKLGYVMSPAT
jgi:transposase